MTKDKWRTVKLAGVATIERDAVQPDEIEQGTTYVGLEHIENGGKILGAKPVDEGELASSKFKFTNHHVLYGKLRPYLAKIACPDFSGICSTDILPILPSPHLERRFLCYFLRQPSMVDYANSRATGANLPRLSPSALAEFEIPLPPPAEQRRIAEVLDRAEALRAKRRAALAQLDSLTQSLFLDLFGDPATNPKGWPLSAMTELFSASPIFGTMIPPSVDGGEWLSLRVGNIQDWQLDLSDRKFVNLPANMIERHSVLDGDMLMARAIASQEHLGKSVVVTPSGRKWAFDSHLMRLRFDQSKAHPEIIRHTLMTPGGRSLFLKAARRSAVQFNINTKEISALRVPVPPIRLQREFARRVAVVEKLKTTQRAALAELDALFASLQHRAFRGEL
jgi:type I restriction enzyme S subunit